MTAIQSIHHHHHHNDRCSTNEKVVVTVNDKGAVRVSIAMHGEEEDFEGRETVQ